MTTPDDLFTQIQYYYKASISREKAANYLAKQSEHELDELKGYTVAAALNLRPNVALTGEHLAHIEPNRLRQAYTTIIDAEGYGGALDVYFKLKDVIKQTKRTARAVIANNPVADTDVQFGNNVRDHFITAFATIPN